MNETLSKINTEQAEINANLQSKTDRNAQQLREEQEKIKIIQRLKKKKG